MNELGQGGGLAGAWAAESSSFPRVRDLPSDDVGGVAGGIDMRLPPA
jgi:hypothetical protein